MNSNLKAGDVAPDFALPDPVNGGDVRLSGFRGQDILLVFQRGTWCPFCREQLRLLAENHARLAAAGIAVLAVACQSPESIKRWCASNPLPFPLLSDSRRSAAKAYGTYYAFSWEGIHLSQPAMFVIDRTGTITFAHTGRKMDDLPVLALLSRFVTYLDPPPAVSAIADA